MANGSIISKITSNVQSAEQSTVALLKTETVWKEQKNMRLNLRISQRTKADIGTLAKHYGMFKSDVIAVLVRQAVKGIFSDNEAPLKETEAKEKTNIDKLDEMTREVPDKMVAIIEENRNLKKSLEWLECQIGQAVKECERLFEECEKNRKELENLRTLM